MNLQSKLPKATRSLSNIFIYQITLKVRFYLIFNVSSSKYDIEKGA